MFFSDKILERIFWNTPFSKKGERPCWIIDLHGCGYGICVPESYTKLELMRAIYKKYGRCTIKKEIGWITEDNDDWHKIIKGFKE